ncbi:MAG: protein kinase [Acidobacteria bacterium]|nr:protein kinase [Acidobacteriota bacterium]
MTPTRWQQIDQLLDAVLELPAAERAAFLTQACKDDDELRREVESLLSASDNAGSFINTSAAHNVAQVMAEPPRPSPPSSGALVGRAISHYQIIALLGTGGMGEVYRAKDTRLGRHVAIKVLPQHLSSHPDALARFEREAKAVAALSHPNILSIHDFGTDNGLTYAVMELLEGETLRARLQRAPLPWRETVKVSAAIADGLAAAHARGIIHRDIKPENVFLTSDGLVKVLDFGIARVKPLAASAAETLVSLDVHTTKPGTLMGTIGYMSPEQVRGETVEAPSDIFSLGSMLVEMITGKRPFVGKTAAETMAAILRDDPPSLIEFDSEIPFDFERIALRCLQKEPAERFQSARDLSLDLRSLLTISRSTSSGFATATGRTNAAAPNDSAHRPLLLASLFLLATVVAIAAGFWWVSRQRPDANAIAILPFVNASGDPNTEYLSQGVPESITNSLAALPQLRVMGWSTVQYKTQTQKAPDPRVLGKELNVSAVVLGKIAQQGDKLVISVEMIDVKDGAHLWGEVYKISLAEATATQTDIARRISDSLQIELSGEQQRQLAMRYTANAEAYQLYLQGRLFLNQRAGNREESLRKAVSYFEQTVASDPRFALGYAGLADAYALINEDFRTNSRKAIAAANQALALDDKLAEPRATLAFVQFHYDWLWAEAEQGFRAAIALNPRYATAHHWFAELLTTQGRFDEALREIKIAHDLDPLSAPINNDWGVYLYFAHRYPEAIAQLRRALELNENTTAHRWIVNCYEQLKQYDKMEAEYLSTLKEPTEIAELQQAFASDGINGFRRKRLAGLYAQLQKGNEPSLFSFAYLHALLGEKDRALEFLEKGFQQKHYGLNYLKVEPRFDALRNDARFNELLRRVGLLP